MYHDIYLFMHHIDCYYYYFFFFGANLQSTLGFFFLVLFCVPCPYPSTMTRKTRANRKASTSSDPSFESDRFLRMKNQELFETLNLKRKIWAEHKVLLDELDLAIRANFERRGWLPLLDIDYPPPATLIREFYSNLSIHVYDSNTLVKSWIQGVEFTITPSVVADALGVPVVPNPIYPYDGSPPLNDIMS